MHRGDVGEHVLDPVGGHDRDRRARLDAQRDQRRRDVATGLVHLGPGQRAPLTGRGVDAGRDLVAVRRAVAVRRHGPRHHVEHGPPLEELPDLPAFVRGSHAGHGRTATRKPGKVTTSALGELGHAIRRSGEQGGQSADVPVSARQTRSMVFPGQE